MSEATVRSIGSIAAEAAVSIAWAHWGSLAPGAITSGEERTRSIVDPEALVLLSLAVREHEARLTDLLAGWARSGSALLSVQRLKTLARQGFYDGVPFHRVIDGFMAQTGDPTGTGMGGSDLPDLRAEFSDLPFVRGTVGMARSAEPDSANSQFFIAFDRAPWLDRQYTVVGEVVDGMDAVDAVKRGDPARNGMVEDPDRILSMRVAAD
jgi:peptidylprolyl isomerase